MKSTPDIKFQLAILADTPEGLDGLSDTDSIEWLFCKQAGDHLFDFYKGHAVVSSLDLVHARFDLQDLLGFIVIGSEEKLEAIRRDWDSWLPSASVTFMGTRKFEKEAILCAAADCIADVLKSQRQYSGRAALQLATYRREFERLQHNFARLEEYVGRHSLQRATEIFEYPIDSRLATEPTVGPGRVTRVAVADRFLTQYLPVDSLGLCSLSINVGALPDRSAAPLCVTLKALETGQIFGKWSISASQAEVGWIELALDSAIDESALSLVMTVEWPVETAGWVLALGPPHPCREFCARSDTGEYLDAPLALRLFSSLPGVRVSPTTAAIRPVQAPHVSAEFIPYDVYQQVAQISPAAGGKKPALVSYDPDLSCITVHPQKGVLTIARIKVEPPRHAWAITAQIHLADGRANPTQFGLMVCQPGDEAEELEALKFANSRSRSFSGWTVVSALEKKRILILLPPLPEDQLSVYLVTRQAPELSPDFAWARFSKLEFNILPKSMIAADKECESTPATAQIGSVHQSSTGEAVESDED